MAVEAPEAGMVVGEVPELGMMALSIAVGCAEIIRPLLDFLAAAPARGPVLDAAAAAVVVTLPMAYLTGVMLLYLHVAPARAAAVVQPAALGRFIVLVCALLLFMASLFFVAAGFR